jgi:hypothetical protein
MNAIFDKRKTSRMKLLGNISILNCIRFTFYKLIFHFLTIQLLSEFVIKVTQFPKSHV